MAYDRSLLLAARITKGLRMRRPDLSPQAQELLDAHLLVKVERGGETFLEITKAGKTHLDETREAK